MRKVSALATLPWSTPSRSARLILTLKCASEFGRFLSSNIVFRFTTHHNVTVAVTWRAYKLLPFTFLVAWQLSNIFLIHYIYTLFNLSAEVPIGTRTSVFILYHKLILVEVEQQLYITGRVLCVSDTKYQATWAPSTPRKNKSLRLLSEFPQQWEELQWPREWLWRPPKQRSFDHLGYQWRYCCYLEYRW